MTEIIETPSDDTVRRRDAVMDAASLVLSFHVPDEAGLCAGCLAQWNRWVLHVTCTQMRWARMVLETHGGGEPGPPVAG